jgi:hypothetical protein
VVCSFFHFQLFLWGWLSDNVIMMWHGNWAIAGASLLWWKICQDATGLMAFGAGYAAKLSWRAAGLLMGFIVAGTGINAFVCRMEAQGP